MNENPERWLYFAREDLAAAQSVLASGIWNQVCFHSQQCVEKALKSALSQGPQPLPKTHSIAELVARLPQIVAAALPATTTDLDAYYVPTRYPDALPGMLPTGLPTESDAREAFNIAQQVLKTIEHHTP